MKICCSYLVFQIKPTFCTYNLHSPHGQFSGFHFFISNLKISWLLAFFNLSGKGSSIKYIHSDFVILDPSPPVRAHTLLAYTSSPSTSVRILYFKEDRTNKFQGTTNNVTK